MLCPETDRLWSRLLYLDTPGRVLGLEKKMFASCNSLKKISRSVKSFFGFHYLFDQKGVLSMFYVDWESKRAENI